MTKQEKLAMMLEKHQDNSVQSQKALLITERIKLRLKRTAEDIVLIGQDLIELKAELGHGAFLPWIEREFEMSQRTAYNFISVAEKFGGKLANFANLKPSIIYALAEKNTPDQVVETVLEKAESGEKVTLKEIEELKQQLKAKDDRISQLSMNFERLDQTNKQLEESLYEADEKLERAKAEYEEKVEKRAKMLASVEADKVAREYQKQIEKLETEKTKLEDAKKQAIEEGKKAMEALKANPDPETQDKINALRKEEYLLAKQLEQVETRLSNAKSAEELRVSNAHAFQNFSDGYQRWIASNPKAIAAITSGQIGDYSLAEAEMLANSLETFANQIREAVQTARIENAREVEDTPMKLIEAEVYAD